MKNEGRKRKTVSRSAADGRRRFFAFRFSLFAFLVILSVAFTMATALSVADFLRILFEPETTAAAPSGNLVAVWLEGLYGWLIAFGRMKAIVMFSILVFALYGLKNVFTYLSALSIAAIRAGIVRDVRNALFRKAMHLPVGYYATHRRGDILARFGGDVVEYDESYLGSIQMLLVSIISMVMYMAMLFYLNLKLTLFVLLMLPVVGVVISGLSRKLKRKSQAVQEQNARLTALTEETMAGLKVIKAYTAIEFSNRRFRTSNRDYTRRRTSMFRRIYMASPMSDFLGNAVVVGILLFGSWLVMGGDSGLTPELFISYIMLFVLMIPPAKDLTTALAQMKKGRACADRMKEFLALEPEPDGDRDFEGLRHSIEFRHVSFSYDGVTPVIDDLNLVIPKGSTVAVVGSSGSGKSTVAALLARFYDPQQGDILYDGVTSVVLRSASLRHHIGFVTQDTDLFHDTVAANIALGHPTASREEIERAARVANAHDFIMQLPQGYLTDIGEGGGALSGGQRQRISIARAVLTEPDILILDEATSALDTESERQVQQALDSAMKGRTCIVIAHRLSTVVGADEIVVLEHGRVVQRGTHESLMAVEGRYRDLVNLQKLG